MRVSFGVAIVALSAVLLMPGADGLMTIGAFVSEGNPVYGPSGTSVIRTVYGVTTTYKVEPWPEGTLDLVNDPLRTIGWQIWFSGSPSDLETFNFKAASVDEINHLIRKLSAIKADHVQLAIKFDEPENANEHYPCDVQFSIGNQSLIDIWFEGLELAIKVDEPDNTNEPYPSNVQSSIGNQSLIDIWFEGLECDEAGARVWGVHRPTEPPKATPPTLTLTMGAEGVELDKLEVPPKVEVVASVADAYRSAYQGSETLKAVDRFVAKHAAKNQSTRQ
jgi:hypothetical protein